MGTVGAGAAAAGMAGAMTIVGGVGIVSTDEAGGVTAAVSDDGFGGGVGFTGAERWRRGTARLFSCATGGGGDVSNGTSAGNGSGSGTI